MKTYRLLCALAFLAGSLCVGVCEAPLSLAGSWRFALDRHDAGVGERWFDKLLPGAVRLPGALPAQGIGEDVTVDTKWTGGIVDRSFFTAPEFEKYRQPGQVKVPFWLQPEKYYVGAAWYQRDVEVPQDWAGKRIVLTLERPHWETRVWVDDRLVGTNNALATPHDHDLGTGLAPGRHRLTIRVDNRLVVDVGENSHSVSDHTQGNWNGLVGRIEWSATPPVWIDDLQVYPRVATKSVTVKGTIGNASGQPGSAKVELRVEGRATGVRRTLPFKRLEVAWDTRGGRFEAEYPLGPDAQTWDEFSPALYRLRASLGGGQHVREVDFGLREFSTQGTQFVINGRKTLIRGTLECAIFPKTGHPPTDVDAWTRLLRAAQAHGLNNLRFHSWCPPQAAFAAADELGVYLHVEASSWANQSTTLGDGKPVDRWIYEETDRILKYYGNHPSFVLMPHGNEPGGARHAAFLAQWVNHFKAKDPRRLWTSGAGWPQLPENQWHSTPDPRVQAWGGGLKSRINARAPETRTDYRDYIRARSVPVISHELGQWCVYPNFDEMPKYTGYLKPRNFEIFRDTLQSHQMGDLARPFLLASGKLQTLCYKEDIESALRTPGMGGFQLLDLHDFPGQGTALVGVLDPFWEAKGYVSADEFRRFCNRTVPLARLSRRVFTTADTLEADLEVAHFGPAPVEEATLEWSLVADAGKTVANGWLGPKPLPVDNALALGSIRVALASVPAPARYRLVAELAVHETEGSGAEPRRKSIQRYANDWDVWVYPPQLETAVPSGILETDEMNDAALAALKSGGKVVLMLPPHRVVPDKKLGPVALGFSSVFWNTAWTGRQPPHTLGILCDPKHPALAEFPTDFHSNWQWWYLLSRAGAMILDDLPAALRPTVQVIDDWVTARRLGLVFEARLGQGRLLVSSIDLRGDLGSNPVARQLRSSLLRYVASDRFEPAVEVTADQVRGLFAPRLPMQRAGVRVLRAGSYEQGQNP
jgi:hypothetical protein